MWDCSFGSDSCATSLCVLSVPSTEPDKTRAAVSRDGDLWLIGPHRLYVGNALERTSWKALMGDDKAQMVFTDPPYNVPVAGHISGLGRTKHREFAMASGEMTPEGFTAFLAKSINHSSGRASYLCPKSKVPRSAQSGHLQMAAVRQSSIFKTGRCRLSTNYGSWLRVSFPKGGPMYWRGFSLMSCKLNR